MRPAWIAIIKQIQKEAGISQRELARRTCVGRSALRRIMSGEVSPTLDALEKIMTVFGYEIDAIPIAQPADKPVAIFVPGDADL